jgi:hypothetical protein
MSLPGRQWSHVELRCPPGPLRVPGEFPQASRGLYDNPAYFDDDGSHHQNNGRAIFGACLGYKSNKAGAVQ